MRSFKNLAELMLCTEALHALHEELTYDQLFRMSEPKRFTRSLSVKMPPLNVSQGQTANSWNFDYYFNAKGNPSTTGLRHHGYVRFRKPKKTHAGKQTPLSQLPVEVDCECPDYRFRWAHANKQRGAGKVGPNSLNQALNKAPKITNPKGAPGLCIAEDELIATARGLLPIQHVLPSDLVWTLDGWQKVTAAAQTGRKQIVEIKLNSGKTIRLTPEHQVFAFHASYGFSWIAANNLAKDHHLCVCLPGTVSTTAPTIKVEAFTSWNKNIKYPERTVILNEIFAELTGYMISEGSVNFFAGESSALKNDFLAKWKLIFGPNSATLRTNGCYIGAHGSRILIKTGFKFGSYSKAVPAWIMQSPKPVITAFIRGCYAGDGNFRGRHSTYATVSEKLARNLQLLINCLGVSASLDCYKSGAKKSLTWHIRTSSEEETKKLFTLLNPIRGYSTQPVPGGKPAHHNYVVKSPYRLITQVIVETLPRCLDKTLVPITDTAKYFPHCEKLSPDPLACLLSKTGKLEKLRIRKSGKPHNIATLYDIHDALRPHFAKKLTSSLDLPENAFPDRIHRMALRRAIDQLAKIAPEAHENLKTLVREDVFFDRVSSVTLAGTVNVYDLTVENSSHFTANGAVVHNCKHLLATRDYIYGLLSGFPDWVGDTERLDRLTRRAQKRWINYDAEMEKARERDARIAASKALRNVGIPPEDQGKKPAPDLPPELPDEEETGTPAGLAVPPGERGRGFPAAPKPATPLAVPPGQRGRGFPPAKPPVSGKRNLKNESVNIENVDISNIPKHWDNLKMKTSLRTLTLQETQVIENARKLVLELADDFGGEEAMDGLPSEAPPPVGQDEMPGAEPPMSDSAVGASTSDNVALSLLREIRDILSELAATEDAEKGDVPEIPDEGEPGEGDLDHEPREEEEEFKPGKRPMPIPSGAGGE